MNTAYKLKHKTHTVLPSERPTSHRLSIRETILLRGQLFGKPVKTGEPSVGLFFEELEQPSRLVRLVDVVVGGLGALLLVALLPLIALGNKLFIGGSVFVTRAVYGWRANTIDLLMFRTEKNQSLKLLSGDHLIGSTGRWGRLLLRSGLYKLPALLQVIRGELSLIGPVVRTTNENERWHRRFAEYYKRFALRPGWLGADFYRSPVILSPTDQDRMVRYELRFVQQPNLKNFIRYLKCSG